MSLENIADVVAGVLFHSLAMMAGESDAEIASKCGWRREIVGA